MEFDETKHPRDEDGKFKIVGKFNKDVYKFLKSKYGIKDPDVAITDRWLKEHIEPGHSGFYKNNKKYISKIIKDPDYIIEDSKRNNTVLFIGKLEKSQIVISLRTNEENGYKNTIITFFGCGKSTLDRILRNKNVIYNKTKK